MFLSFPVNLQKGGTRLFACPSLGIGKEGFFPDPTDPIYFYNPLRIRRQRRRIPFLPFYKSGKNCSFLFILGRDPTDPFPLGILRAPSAPIRWIQKGAGLAPNDLGAGSNGPKFGADWAGFWLIPLVAFGVFLNKNIIGDKY